MLIKIRVNFLIPRLIDSLSNSLIIVVTFKSIIDYIDYIYYIITAIILSYYIWYAYFQWWLMH